MQVNKLCASILLVATSAAQAATHLDMELSARHDDNASRAEDAHDRFGDNLLDFGLTATHTLMLSPNSGLRLRGNIGLTEHMHHTELNLLAAGAGVSYRIQPVAGYTAPWLEFGVAAERLQFRDSTIRDGTGVSAEAAVGKRFTDRIVARVGAGWEQRRADDTEVFEWNRQRLFSRIDYRVGLDAIFYANFSRDFGDQVFTATPAPAFRSAAKAIADDPAFGIRRAYRLDAVSTTLELGLSMPLNAFNTLDFGARHFRAEADGSHTYNDTELRASWLYRFR